MGSQPGRDSSKVPDGVAVAQREADVVETLEDPVLGERVEREGPLQAGGGGRDLQALDVDGQLQGGVGQDGVEQGPPEARRSTLTGTTPALVQLFWKMSPKRGEITARKP